MRRWVSSLGPLFLLFCAASSDARTWYVKPDSTGDLPTIQAAMKRAHRGDEILLAPGTYSWTTQGTGGTSFGESMVEVEPGVSLRSEGGPENTILDGEYRVRVILCQDAGQVRIAGLTVRRGWSTIGGGGGVLSLGNSQPTILNCIVRDNRVANGLQGGGIGGFDPGPSIINCEVFENGGDFDTSGGGIFIVGGSVSGCSIRGNAVFGDAGSRGGGILAFDSAVNDCWIEGNSSGNVFGGTGGGVYLVGTSTVTRCVFVNNLATGGTEGALGGAIFCSTGNFDIADCILVGNLASGTTGLGGAIAGRSAAQVTISGCSLVANKGRGTPSVGGIALLGPGSASNTIVAWSEGAACSGPITFSCTDLYGNSLGDIFCGTDAGGNFSADPQFCSEDPASSLSVWLQQDSPCAPGNHPGGLSCGLIGARTVGCGTVLVKQTSWTEVKSLYRR